MKTQTWWGHTKSISCLQSACKRLGPHHLGAKTSPCRCRCQGPYKDHKPLALLETGQHHPLPTSQGHTGHSQTFQRKTFTIRNAPFVMDNKDREALRELHAKCAGMCFLALNFKVVFLGEIWPPFCLWGREGRRMTFHFIGTKWNDSRGAAGQGPGCRPSLGLYFCSRSAQGTRRKVRQESLQTGAIRSHPHNVTQQFSTWKQPRRWYCAFENTDYNY